MKPKQVPKFVSTLVCGLLGVGLAGSVAAQSTSGAEGLLNDSWVLNVGGFFFGTSVKANLNGQSSSNPEIDFDETFGKASDASRIRADVLWRLTPTHRLRALYFDNSQSRSTVLENDFEWGDYTFLKGSNVSYSEKFNVFELAYEYAFLRRPTYEVAASLGVHYMDLQMQLSGTAIATGPGCETPPCTASGTTKVSTLPAPLPVIGLRAGWVVAPDWYLDAQGQIFKVKIDGYDGRWSDMRVGATWMFHRHFGVGAGYNWFTTKVDVAKDDFNGRLRLGYSGVQVYLTGAF